METREKFSVCMRSMRLGRKKGGKNRVAALAKEKNGSRSFGGAARKKDEPKSWREREKNLERSCYQGWITELSATFHPLNMMIRLSCRKFFALVFFLFHPLTHMVGLIHEIKRRDMQEERRGMKNAWKMLQIRNSLTSKRQHKRQQKMCTENKTTWEKLSELSEWAQEGVNEWDEKKRK